MLTNWKALLYVLQSDWSFLSMSLTQEFFPRKQHSPCKVTVSPSIGGQKLQSLGDFVGPLLPGIYLLGQFLSPPAVVSLSALRSWAQRCTEVPLTAVPVLSTIPHIKVINVLRDASITLLILDRFYVPDASLSPLVLLKFPGHVGQQAVASPHWWQGNICPISTMKTNSLSPDLFEPIGKGKLGGFH